MSDFLSESNQLVETTDYYEFLRVVKRWKNMCFLIMILCLLLLQGAFWMIDRGYISTPGQIDDTRTAMAAAAPGPPATPLVLAAVDARLSDPNLPSEVNPSLELDPSDANQSDPNEVSATAFSETPPQGEVPRAKGNVLSGLSFETLTVLMHFLNALLVLTAALYCLSLFFSLELTLQGGLGGTQYISKAFFLSLVALVLMCPWQSVFGKAIIGAIYSPGALARASFREFEDTFQRALYYLRFTGFGAALLLLLLISQIRSARWTKAVLHRINII